MKVVYAHTDSIYVPIDNIEKAKIVCNELNNHVRESFPNVLGLENHPVTLEFEKYYESLGVGIKKNRNAGLINWKDGEFLDEQEFIVTGFSMKKITENQIGKKFQGDLLRMWVEQKTKYDIVKFCKEQFNLVNSGKIGLDKIVKRRRLKNSLENYKSIAGGVAGVCYYNQHIDPDNPINDSFLYIKCKYIKGPQFVILPNGKERKATFVSVKEMKEFDDKFTPDWKDYATTSIMKKAKPIFDAMGWDCAEFMIDTNQKQLEDWL
jgi:DNA polymerase elongation subunit (family B)